MNSELSAADCTFRDQVLQFLAEQLTPELRRAGQLMTSVFADFEAVMAWHRILHRRGWVAPDWPAEYGGPGWTLTQRNIFLEECKLAGAPALLPMGIQMLGPMLIRYGTAEQKAYYLPRILSGEDVWCQGYSEPGAGSDLAALQTRAVRSGEHYIIDGSKIWTSYAHYSNRIFCLVRTSSEGKPQAGITFILVDMDAPGISVAPIVGLDGRVEQCQVFFDNVKVPVTNVVGAENQGWTVAKYLLEFERGGHFFTIDHKKLIAKVRRIMAQEHNAEGLLYADDPVFRHKLAELEVDALALEYTEQRIRAALNAGQNPGALSSLTKVVGTELSQRFNELAVEALGLYIAPVQHEALAPDFSGMPIGPDYGITVLPEYINTRASTIYGGSAEIQRGIIAKHVLGL
jgi:alkylation response protein AidB-like acyl-CoA dehydrogenase